VAQFPNLTPSDLGELQELCYVMYECRYVTIRKLFSEGVSLERMGLVPKE